MIVVRLRFDYYYFYSTAIYNTVNINKFILKTIILTLPAERTIPRLQARLSLVSLPLEVEATSSDASTRNYLLCVRLIHSSGSR